MAPRSRDLTPLDFLLIYLKSKVPLTALDTWRAFVSSRSNGAFEETFSYQTKVDVVTDIKGGLACPEYVIRDEDFECILTTYKGDNMTLSMHIAPDAECYRDAKGLDYHGHVSNTATGKACQTWSSVSPHTHIFTDLGEHNYCRNPDSKPDGPWCYTVDPSTPWEHCHITVPSDTCNIYDWSDSAMVYLGSDIDKLISHPRVNPVSIYNEMYIKLEDPVVHGGMLMGIEAVVETPGILEFRIFRPVEGFCGIANVDVHAHHCSRPIKCSDYVGSRYSFTTQKCFNADGIIQTDIPYDADTFTVQSTYTFDTDGNTGRLYFPIDWEDRSWLRSGCVISYNRVGSTGKLAAVDDGVSWGDSRFSVLSTVTLNQGLPKASYQHLYRGVFSKTTLSRVRINYPPNWPVGTHDVNVFLNNGVDEHESKDTVFVTDALYNITVNVSDFVSTNESVDLIATVYDFAFSFAWDFGDGIILYNESEAVNHTWTTHGFYNLSVTAQHPYGDRLFSKEIKVEDPIYGFQWTDSSHLTPGPVMGIEPTSFGEDTKGYWFYTQGTDVAFEVRVFESDDTSNTLYNFTLDMPGDQWSTNTTITANTWNIDNLRATYDSQFYVGCFVDDDTNRGLPVGSIQSPYMTHTMCFDHCLSLGMRFASLQYGLECYCSNAEIDTVVYSQRPDEECNMACSGDENSQCGGGLRNRVYEIEGHCGNDVVQGIADSNVVPNSQLTASTSYFAFFEDYAAVKARLHTPAYSWCAATNDVNQWVQIDLVRYQYISGVITQGCASYDRWVTKYSVDFSMNSADTLEYVRDSNNARQIFEANSDRNTPVTQLFDRPVRARYVKLRPMEWVGMICLRFELLGCDMMEDAECFLNVDESDYHGYLSTTENGRTCQKWTTQSPHPHTYTLENYPNNFLGDHSFCRDPSNNGRAWCYTTNLLPIWEYCDVPDPRTLCRKDTTIDGLLAFHVDKVTVVPVTIRAFNNVSESTLNASVYIQKPVVNLRTTPTEPTAFEVTGEIPYFFDDGTDVTVTILSSDMAEPTICATNTYNGTCYIESFTHYLQAAEYCFSVTGYNLVSTLTILHCHIVVYGIRDFQVVPSQVIFIPPNALTLTIDALSASRCNLTIDFGDGSSLLYEFIEELNRTNGDNYMTTHDYTIPGTYLVQVNMWNDVSSVTYDVVLYVQYPVDPLLITATNPFFELSAISGTSNIDFSLDFNGELQPTGVTVNYTISGPMSFTHSQVIADEETYPFVESIQVSEFGTFQISWHAYNKLSFITGTTTVDVDKPIQGLQIVPTGNPFGVVDEVLSFEIVNIWGSRITYTVSYGDGKQDDFTISEGGVELTHSWTVNAFYLVTVTAQNTVGTVSYTLSNEIEIVLPVEGIRLAARKLNMLTAQVPRESAVPVDVFIDRNVAVPPDASITVDFGDGASVFDQLTDFLLQIDETDDKDTQTEKLGRTLTYFYSEAGVYTITIYVANVATSVTESYEVFVYEEISDVAMNVKFTTGVLPPSGTPDAAFDIDHFTEAGIIAVPLDKASLLTVSYATGTDLSYEWDFGDGPDSLITTTEPRAVYWYQTLELTLCLLMFLIQLIGSI
ncbi:uncharacterized protein [Amphiura filiformis]|uniref:uncharacterized protein n=1 Tax=Amphiura filiformis TaxID=82378 RepID=UPI003B2173B8